MRELNDMLVNIDKLSAEEARVMFEGHYWKQIAADPDFVARNTGHVIGAETSMFYSARGHAYQTVQLVAGLKANLDALQHVGVIERSDSVGVYLCGRVSARSLLGIWKHCLIDILRGKLNSWKRSKDSE